MRVVAPLGDLASWIVDAAIVRRNAMVKSLFAAVWTRPRTGGQDVRGDAALLCHFWIQRMPTHDAASSAH